MLFFLVAETKPAITVFLVILVSYQVYFVGFTTQSEKNNGSVPWEAILILSHLSTILLDYDVGNFSGLPQVKARLMQRIGKFKAQEFVYMEKPFLS